MTNSVEEMILTRFASNKSKLPLNSQVLAAEFKISHSDLFSNLKSLEDRQKICLKTQKEDILYLTSEGKTVLQDGSPEFKILSVLPKEGVFKDDLENKMGINVVKIALTNGMKEKFFKIAKDQNRILVLPFTPNKIDKCREKLENLKISENGRVLQNDVDAKILNYLKRRKYVQIKNRTTFLINKGELFNDNKRFESVLTSEMIKDGSWKTSKFKKYNLKANGPPLNFGCLHPLLKVRAEFRSVLLQMGFSEMATNRYVESSFWNFDALFQPQQHPARDAHDTFFIKSLKSSLIDAEDNYIERVKAAHENGGNTGSIGWRYVWSENEARKHILRTHTTAVSSRELFKIAQQKPFKPSRRFSIDRVFRNETIDATHLAEFHQVEGFVADYDLTLADLLGVVSEFFKRIGIQDVRFKPAYNPYTEPSMEIFGFSKELNEWIEVGNSGVFRPEMLLPMGFPPNVKVIAWGLSLERPTMIKYGVANIRELFGHRVAVGQIKANPIALLNGVRSV